MSKTESDTADICDRFEAANSTVTPVMVVSPDRALCTRLGVTLESLKNFMDFGVLSQETQDSFYIYAISHGDHTQVGVCAAVSIEDYKQGVIKRHEKTTLKKEFAKESDFQVSKYHSEKVNLILFN